MNELQDRSRSYIAIRSFAERMAASVRSEFAALDPVPAEAHPKVRRIVEYWRSLMPGPGLLPGRRQFDPTAVPDLLNHLWLLEIVPDDPRRFRLRLVGGALTEAGAGLRKGQFFVESGTPEEAARAHARFSSMEKSRLIDWRRGPPALGYMEHVRELERVMLPLAADGRSVDMFLCLTVFYFAEGQAEGGASPADRD